ncbi:MAG: protein kinase [Kofleriaceae bacterium]
MSADQNDRTATLQPRTGTGAHAIDEVPEVSREVELSEVAAETQLPVDDPNRYEQIREHARGGLGRIIRAVDRRLGRTVAVKELLRRDDWHEARFVREALITARLEHPGIVPVHEAGRWPNGDPYYVMKLVEGRTLKELMTSHQTPRERLGLLQHLIAVADAVGYAHSEGVVHRDVKPSNVIVGSFGETIVVDWGLARDCKRDIAEPQPELLAEGSGASTISGKVVGTPAYMAPEQARGELVDARADVYAIGAVLYELLAGKAPHHDQTPKAMLDRVIAGPPPPLVIVAPTVPRELADIIAKAMARSPEDRYANATKLAEDLRAFQTGKLVTAHTYTSWQLVRKKLAQHRGVVVVAIASAVALGAVGVGSVRKVVAERDIAQGERGRAESAAQAAEAKQRELVLLQAETSLPKDPTAALAWLKNYPIGPADHEKVVDVIDEAIAMGSARHVFRPGGWLLDAAFTPDSKFVVSAANDGNIRRYDLTTRAMTIVGHTPSDPEVVVASPDGQWIVTGGALGEVIAWPSAGGPPRRLAERGKLVTSIKFDATGERMLVDRDGRAEILDLEGNLTRIGPASAQRVVVARDDWTRRAALVAPNQVAVGNDTPDHVIAQTDRAIAYLALSPNGDTVLIHDGQTLYSVPYGGGPLTKLAPYDAMINELAWSRDSHQLAIAGKRVDVPVIDLVTHAVRELRGHSDQIYTVEFTHDGRSLLTGSDDSTARLWNLLDGSSLVFRGHEDDVYRARLSPDEKLAATASLDGSLRVWPLVANDTKILLENQPITWMSMIGDKAVVRTESSVASWDLNTGVREALVSWNQGLGKGEPSPDGQHLLAFGPKWTLELRGRDGKPPLVLSGHHAVITHVAWSRDSTTAYSSSSDGTLRKWDLVTGKSTLLIDGDTPVLGFAVAKDNRIAAQIGDAAMMMIYPDGRAVTLGTGPSWCSMRAEFDAVRDRLMIQRCDHSFGIYDGKRLVNLATDRNAIERITVSPDGERIAGAMSDRTVRVWDAQGPLLAILRGHSDLVLDVAFSPDGSELASASYDKTIRIWQLATKRHRVLRGHAGAVDSVIWRGMDQLVTASYDGTLRIWHVPATEPPSQDEVSQRLDAATTATIDAQNRATTISG